LLRSVCDSFLLVADGQVKEFDGDVDDYLSWLTARRQAQNAKPDAMPRAAEKASRRETRNNAPKAPAEKPKPAGSRRPLEKEAEKLDRDLAKWNSEKQGLDSRLADPALYQTASTADLRTMAAHQSELAHLIEAAEHRWLEVHAQLEEMGAA
jgi:ATP-binding cassette, subfamily F, member 3